ncbi:MAG: hypothetical protein E7035_07375 [Verrucomicrobiaceae bacterium]|nr:hypothetical protein [Verrucomicrobiaceae bacterium]
MAEIQTKVINTMTPIMPSETRKMLSGDGVIELGDIKTFIISELSSKVQQLQGYLATAQENITKLQEADLSTAGEISNLQTGLRNLASSVNNIASGGLVFNTICAQVMQDGKAVDGEFGYVVLKKTSTGKLTMSVLNQTEYEAIFKEESTNE